MALNYRTDLQDALHTVAAEYRGLSKRIIQRRAAIDRTVQGDETVDLTSDCCTPLPNPITRFAPWSRPMEHRHRP